MGVVAAAMSGQQVVQVECYCGHTYAQEPRAIVWQGQRYVVVQVEHRWRSPQGPVFQVQTQGGARFEVCYRELEGSWTVRTPVDVCSPPSQRVSAVFPPERDNSNGGQGDSRQQ